MGDADFWELLTKHGISSDSATAIVHSHHGMSDADLWERLHAAGAAPDAATQIVQSRGTSQGGGGLQDVSDQLQQQVNTRQGQIDAQKPTLARDAMAFARAFPGTSAVMGTPTTSDVPLLARQGVALAAGAVPGSTALGAYVASKSQGRPYADVMRDVNAQMSDMPGVERTGLETIGGLLPSGLASKAVSKIPFLAGIANPVTRGAATGLAAGAPLAAAYRFGQPNPESMASRVSGTEKAAAIGGGLGALGGAVAPMIAARRMASGAPRADVAASDANAAAQETNEQNFGKARTEAAQNQSSPLARAALANPDIAPYVREVNENPVTRNLSDAEKLLEARNLMTERQGQLIGPMDARNPGYGSSLENRAIGAGKGTIDAALTSPNISYSPAITEVIPGQPAQVAHLPAMETAQSPPPDLRTALGNFWDRQAAAASRSEGTVAQQMARQALERHAAESSVQGLRGSPPGPRSVELSPATPDVEHEVLPASREVTPPLVPSFANAEATAAQAARNQEATDLTQRTGRRLMSQGKTPLQGPKKIAQGDMLTGRMFQQFDPGQQQAAQQALLQEIAEHPRFYKVPFLKVPIAPSRASLMAPQLLERMGNPAGSFSDAIRQLLLSGATTPFGNAR